MKLVDGYALARLIGVRPVTIRQWANRGFIGRHGKNHRGWSLYHLDEVLTYAKTRGHAPTCQLADLL